MKRAFVYSLAVCLAVLLAGCGSDNSGGGNPPVSTPSISSMTPSKVSRGQAHVEGTILGNNLGAVVSVNLGEGLAVEQFSSSGSTQITVKFTVSASAAAGARTISVTTSGGTASSSTALTVDSNHAPTAKFTVSPDSGAKNTVFTFDATQSSDQEGSISTYRWDFGDGKTGTGRTTTHQFSNAGSFAVTLTVTDHNNAASSVSKPVEVANGIAPVARYSVSPQSGDIDTTFHFDGSASSDKDGSIVRYEWKFGDGGTATGATVDHKFHASGVFGVKLTVTDNDGLESNLDKDVRVENFNDQAAKAEMADVVTRFFARYSRLDHLDAEVIVEDWSLDPDCPGREREIKIIKAQQLTIAKTTATVVGEFDVYIKPDHTHADVNVIAEFDWTNKDGTTGHARAEHDFDFVFEGGKWQICNFSLIKQVGSFYPE